jgi:hypothetical protein
LETTLNRFKNPEDDEKNAIGVVFDNLMESQSEIDKMRARDDILILFDKAIKSDNYRFIMALGERMTRRVIGYFGDRQAESLYLRLVDANLRREARIVGHYLLGRLYRGYDGRGELMDEVAAIRHYRAAAQLGHLISKNVYISMHKWRAKNSMTRVFYSLWLPFFFVYIAVRIKFVKDPEISLFRSQDVFPEGGKIDQVITRRRAA